MNKDEAGLLKLEILEKLMKMYIAGTKKKADHKDDEGNYEIINFIKDSLVLLFEMKNDPIFKIEDDFIEKFFTCLFNSKIKK